MCWGYINTDATDDENRVLGDTATKLNITNIQTQKEATGFVIATPTTCGIIGQYMQSYN